MKQIYKEDVVDIDVILSSTFTDKFIEIFWKIRKGRE
jgi:hypothetical protein